jgi:hypothetical protein
LPERAKEAEQAEQAASLTRRTDPGQSQLIPADLG